MRKLMSTLLTIAAIAVVSVAVAEDEEPLNQSQANSAVVERLGTLSLSRATSGEGFIASFAVTPSVTCSGSCSGVDVGTWTCADGYSCALDCTTRPPRKYCTRL